MQRWRPGLLLLSILAVLPGCASKSTPELVLIGNLAPFSGPDKVSSDHAKQAILLAVEETNKDSESLPGKRLAVLHPEYPPDKPDTLQSVTVRLVTVDRVVGLYGGVNGMEAAQIGRGAQPYGVSVIAPSMLLPDSLDENLFSVNIGGPVKGQLLARFAGEEFKAEHVLILRDTRLAIGTPVAEAFQKEYMEKTKRRAEVLTFSSDKEVDELAKRVEKGQPGPILYIGQPSGFRNFCSTLRRAGVKRPLFFAGEANHLSFLGTETEPGDNIYWVTPYSPDSPVPANQEFVKKYKERFQETPDVFAALAYDGIRILVQSMHRGRSTDRAEILKQLRSKESKPFECLTTDSLTFNEDHSARRPLFVVRRQDGSSSIIKSFDPDGK
jgi:branched-chain amino acid transport system substrate-binding protein